MSAGAADQEGGLGEDMALEDAGHPFVGWNRFGRLRVVGGAVPGGRAVSSGEHPDDDCEIRRTRERDGGSGRMLRGAR
jgi:hypothetical protein